MTALAIQNTPTVRRNTPKIIIYDDEEAITSTLKSIFAMKNIYVSAFNDFTNAMEAILWEHFDGGIIDINDEQMHPVGLDLIRQFKEVQKGTIVYGLTAYHNYEKLVNELGAIFLEKPFLNFSNALEPIVRNFWGSYAMRKSETNPSMTVDHENTKCIEIDAYIESNTSNSITLSFEDEEFGLVLLDMPLHGRKIHKQCGEILRIKRILKNNIDCEYQLPSKEIHEGSKHTIIDNMQNSLPDEPDDYNDTEQADEYMRKLNDIFSGE